MPSTVTCHGVPEGQSLTAKLFADGSDTQIDAGSFTFATNRKGSGSFSANVTGLHKIELRSAGGVLLWYGFAFLATSGSIEASDTREQAQMRFTVSRSIDATANADVDEAAIAAAVAEALEGGSITITTEGPVLTADGPLEIIAGDDYKNATVDRRVSVTLTGTGYGSLTGDTWTLRLNTRGADALSVSGSASMLSADSLQVKFAITAEQSGGLKATQGEWSVRRAPAATEVAFDVVRGPLIVSRNLAVKRT